MTCVNIAKRKSQSYRASQGRSTYPVKMIAKTSRQPKIAAHPCLIANTNKDPAGNWCTCARNCVFDVDITYSVAHQTTTNPPSGLRSICLFLSFQSDGKRNTDHHTCKAAYCDDCSAGVGQIIFSFSVCSIRLIIILASATCLTA